MAVKTIKRPTQQYPNWLKDISDVANVLGSGGLRPGVARLYDQYRLARRTSMRASLEPPVRRYRDKYEEQKIEADHYARYLARLTLNRFRRSLSLHKFRQTYWNPTRQSYRFRDPQDDVTYNPLTGDFRQNRVWKPNWWFLSRYQDPLYWRRPFQMGPFRHPEDMRKEAYERFIPKQIRRTIGDPREPQNDKDKTYLLRNPYWYVPWSIQTKKIRKTRRRYFQKGYRYYARKTYPTRQTYYSGRYRRRF